MQCFDLVDQEHTQIYALTSLGQFFPFAWPTVCNLRCPEVTERGVMPPLGHPSSKSVRNTLQIEHPGLAPLCSYGSYDLPEEVQVLCGEKCLRDAPLSVCCGIPSVV